MVITLVMTANFLFSHAKQNDKRMQYQMATNGLNKKGPK